MVHCHVGDQTNQARGKLASQISKPSLCDNVTCDTASRSHSVQSVLVFHLFFERNPFVSLFDSLTVSDSDNDIGN